MWMYICVCVVGGKCLSICLQVFVCKYLEQKITWDFSYVALPNFLETVSVTETGISYRFIEVDWEPAPVIILCIVPYGYTQLFLSFLFTSSFSSFLLSFYLIFTLVLWICTWTFLLGQQALYLLIWLVLKYYNEEMIVV